MSGNVGPTGPTESLLARMNASNSNDTEDFRSVIDDLTIENKKLRRRLKKYERLHCSHLQEEKLFEVRIHGLAAHKRRELEHTLKSFASSVEDRSPRKPTFSGTTSPVRALQPSHHKPLSASTFGSGALDSAYASQSGGHPSGRANNGIASRTAHRNVQSYLHDIPSAHMSQPSLGLSSNARRKLVVRRLEQLFTGKGAAAQWKAHSQQQQQLSTAAAEADRSTLEAGGQRVWREGTREAHILPDHEDLRVENMEEITAKAQRSRNDSESGTDAGSTAIGVSWAATPEQRPTRPLDLDIYRAQDPSDNIEYIRHLGLANPAMGDPNTNSDEDGWTYLNLLMNMAQLHTLNVTPEFIRKALSKVSAKFELSPDGNRVRWLGGTEGTSMISDGDESECRGNVNSTGGSLSASKTASNTDLSKKWGSDSTLERSSNPLASTATSFLPHEIGAKRRPVQTAGSARAGTFHYKPLFFHTARSDSGNDGSMSSDAVSSSGSLEIATGLHSSSNDVRERQAKLRGRKHEKGPIIFYNKAKFCTDLSGDPDGPIREDVAYVRYTDQPLGHIPPESMSDYLGDVVSEPMEVEGDEPTTEDSHLSSTALDLGDLMTSISDCANGRETPLPMEVSGLGGVQPEDNFVVKVQTRQKARPRSASKTVPPRPVRRILHRLPKAAIDAFTEDTSITRDGSASLNSEVISAVKTHMPSSTLPPPSYVCLPFSSDDSDGSSSEYTLSDDFSLPIPARIAATDHCPRQRTQPSSFRHLGLSAVSSGCTENKETSYGGASSDSESIDLLAHARVQDPEAVKFRETEFEDNRASQQRSSVLRRSDFVVTQIRKGSKGSQGSSGVDSMSVGGQLSENER